MSPVSPYEDEWDDLEPEVQTPVIRRHSRGPQRDQHRQWGECNSARFVFEAKKVQTETGKEESGKGQAAEWSAQQSESSAKCHCSRVDAASSYGVHAQSCHVFQPRAAENCQYHSPLSEHGTGIIVHRMLVVCLRMSCLY